MWYDFFNKFVIVTAWPIQKICFRTKILYEDKTIQDRFIKGPAILISNHTSVFDYAVYLFVFFTRTLRFQMAELLFDKPAVGILIRLLGGIRVDRNIHDMGCLQRSEDILNAGGIVGIFPEGRIPLENEARPLPFRDGAAYLALATGVPVIPVVTDGSYFGKKRAHVVIGVPLYAGDFTKGEYSQKENIEAVTRAFRETVIRLERSIHDENGTAEKLSVL